MNFTTEITFLLYVLFIAFTYGQVDKAKQFLSIYNKQNIIDRQLKLQVKYIYYTNTTDYNRLQAEEAELEYDKKIELFRQNASKIDLKDVDETIRRQFKLLLETKTPKDPYVSQNILFLKGKMQKIYQQATVKHNPDKVKTIPFKNSTKDLNIDRHMSDIMAGSTDPDELLYVWDAWRDAIGPKVKILYTEYVRLNNIGARENGYKDAGDYKRKKYDVDNLEEVVEEFWEELKPFYEEIHAYIRHRLQKTYPTLIKDGEPLPAHILGNMWAQSWEGLYSRIVPYPNEPTVDVTKAIRETMNVTDMYKKAEDFFVSIGWSRLPEQFWNKSVLEQPKDGREVTCHPSAWDLYGMLNGERDLRLIMCAYPSQNDFIVMHHELGHVYYAMLYWDQPIEFRDGANPGFHEAVGDTLALSVQTPQHLHNIGLLPNISHSKEYDINFLLKTALDTVAFLPYAYVMDKWMWNVYSGDIKPEEYNKKWWELRLKYQGLKAPSKRQDDHVDPAAKIHLTADVPYIRYFLATIFQFVFHKHACKAANFTGNLHECSIYQSKDAGTAFGNMLKLGKSKPWPEALKQFTGSEKLSAQPIMEYFAPLREWLKEQQEEIGYTVGWGEDDVSSGTTLMQSTLGIMIISLLNFALQIFI